MTKNERNQEASFDQSEELIVQNPDKFKPSTVYEEALMIFDKELRTIKHLAQVQDQLKHASTAPRTAAREAASIPFFDLANILGSFAFDTKNIILAEKVKITPSEINKLPDGELVIRFSTFLSAAAEYPTELIGYGVTEQTITTDTAHLNVYQDEIQNQAMRVLQLKEVTNQIKLQFKVVDNSLKPFDSMVEAKRVSDPAWYSLYQSARTIKHSPSSRLSAKGKVFDSVTNQPLPGSVLNITRVGDDKASSGSELQKNVKIRSAGGGFNLKSLPTGTYQFTVTYSGYHVLITTVYINEGILTKVNLPLNKIALAVA